MAASLDTPAARRHLRISDPVLGALMETVGPLSLSASPDSGRPQNDDHFGALLRSIVGQQISTAAAGAIYARLLERFGGRAPTALEMLACDAEVLRREVGLSRAKVSYLRSLAEHVQSGRLVLELLPQLPDERVMAELTAVRGIGEWSAHMFLIFALQRPDVMAAGDLGIRRAVQLAYELPALPSPLDLRERAAPWRPHRTLACRYLWRSLSTEPLPPGPSAPLAPLAPAPDAG